MYIRPLYTTPQSRKTLLWILRLSRPLLQPTFSAKATKKIVSLRYKSSINRYY